MIQVKYIDKIKNKQGVITHYGLIDKQGNKKIITSEMLKNAIKHEQVECVNLTLTSDNRLVDKKINKQHVINGITTKKELTPVEMYMEYLNSAYMKKLRTLGVKPSAEYSIKGKDVILEKVNVVNGTFVIPPFVTGIKTIKGNFSTRCEVFNDCVSLKLINKSRLKSTSYMFSCTSKNLKTLDLNEFDTSRITDMSHMFEGCHSIKALDLSELNTSNVTNMSYMFRSCENLSTLNLSKIDTSHVKSMKSMFQACTGITTLDLRDFNTSNVTDMSSMFEFCGNLKKIELSNFNTVNVIDMSKMFQNCNSLEYLDISNFNGASVETMREMFQHCRSLKSINLKKFNTPNIKEISSIFEGCNKLEQVDISSLNTSQLTSMNFMFANCGSLEKLNIGNFNTSNVKTVRKVFLNCAKLKGLDISNFDFSNVESTKDMFEGCVYRDTFKLPKNFEELEKKKFVTQTMEDIFGNKQDN